MQFRKIVHMEAAHMSHEYLMIQAGNDATRQMRDNQQTEEYIMKLSHSATVTVWFDSGETWEVECGKIIKTTFFGTKVPL